MRLRQQISNCGFEKYSPEVCEVLKEIYLIDVVVENCRSDELRKSILKRDRTLREIEDMAACIEDTEQQMKDNSSWRIFVPNQRFTEFFIFSKQTLYCKATKSFTITPPIDPGIT